MRPPFMATISARRLGKQKARDLHGCPTQSLANNRETHPPRSALRKLNLHGRFRTQLSGDAMGAFWAHAPWFCSTYPRFSACGSMASERAEMGKEPTPYATKHGCEVEWDPGPEMVDVKIRGCISLWSALKSFANLQKGLPCLVGAYRTSGLGCNEPRRRALISSFLSPSFCQSP